MTAKVHWSTRLKQLLVGLILLGVAFLIGLYWVAPNLARAADSYLPRTITELPAGAIRLTNPDGSISRLPVRLAETADARRFGLRDAGPRALSTLFLLYTHPREVTRHSYPMERIRAPLELAVFDSAGTVVEFRRVEPGAPPVVFTVRHRWVLAAKAGSFAHYGIVVESALDVEDIITKAVVAGS